MFLCTYCVLKASSCVTFSVIFATRGSIVCSDSGTRDTIYICVSFALAIWFFDISKNRFKFPVRGCQLIESPDMRLFVGYIICPTSLWYYQIAFRHHHFYYSIQFWKNYEKMWWFALSLTHRPLSIFMQVIGRVLENKAGARSVASTSRSRMCRRYRYRDPHS